MTIILGDGYQPHRVVADSRGRQLATWYAIEVGQCVTQVGRGREPPDGPKMNDPLAEKSCSPGHWACHREAGPVRETSASQPPVLARGTLRRDEPGTWICFTVV